MVSSLGQVAEGKVEVQSPAVWVVGEVVRLRERLRAVERAAAGAVG